MLGKEPKDYIRWINDDNAWGGSIEIAILSGHFGVQVGVLDVQTTRMDVYEASPTAKKRMVLKGDKRIGIINAFPKKKKKTVSVV